MLSFADSSVGVSVNLSAGYWSQRSVTIMPLGDSITSGFNSPPGDAYRGPLWNLMARVGWIIDYVGEYQDGGNALPDRDHEGTNGQTADELIPLIPKLMDQYRPSIVLLMIGSNDMSAGEEPSTLKGGIEKIVEIIAARLPSTTIFVSTLTPLVTGANGWDKISAANNAIRAGVASAASKGEHVVVVEQNVTVGDLVDGTHPSGLGNKKIAQAWHNAMASYFAAHDGVPKAAPMPISTGESAVAGSQGADNIVGDASPNWLSGEGGQDTLMGMEGSDILFGGRESDRLYGGSGNDRLFGGALNDTLSGGPGYDVFVFNTKFGTSTTDRKVNFDRIVDFNVTYDSLWLDNLIFKKLGTKGSEHHPARLSKGFFNFGDRPQDANDYLLYNRKTGILSYDADGLKASKAVEFAHLHNHPKLTYKDFFIM